MANNPEYPIQEEIQDLVTELEGIAEDVSRYFAFRTDRLKSLKDILSVSLLN